MQVSTKNKGGRPLGYSPKTGKIMVKNTPPVEPEKSATRKIVESISLLRGIERFHGEKTDEGVRVAISLLSTLRLGDIEN